MILGIEKRPSPILLIFLFEIEPEAKEGVNPIPALIINEDFKKSLRFIFLLFYLLNQFWVLNSEFSLISFQNKFISPI